MFLCVNTIVSFLVVPSSAHLLYNFIRAQCPQIMRSLFFQIISTFSDWVHSEILIWDGGDLIFTQTCLEISLSEGINQFLYFSVA